MTHFPPWIWTVQYVDSLSNWQWTAFTYTTMTDYPTPADFLENLPAYPVEDVSPLCARSSTLFQWEQMLPIKLSQRRACTTITQMTRSTSRWRVGMTPMACSLGWQACTKIIMPMTVSNWSMLPPSGFSYEENLERCFESYRVRPRSHWISTEYGGMD